MNTILEQITEWLKGMLIDGIMNNLSGMFDAVNQQVGDVAAQVGRSPSAFSPGVFSMVRNVSESVIIPIAGMILTFIACYELIQMIIDHNNLSNFETWIFFKWVFKTFVAVLLITNTFNITMAVFDVAQHVVNASAGIISGSTAVDASTLESMRETLEEMELGPLLGLFLQSFVVQLCSMILSVVIFVIVYGRMVEIYLMTSLAPIPFATFGNREQSQIGQNYLRSLFALGFQGFLIMICVGIYAVLVQTVSFSDDIIASIWGVMGYTVLLCFSPPGTVSKSKTGRRSLPPTCTTETANTKSRSSTSAVRSGRRNSGGSTLKSTSPATPVSASAITTFRCSSNAMAAGKPCRQSPTSSRTAQRTSAGRATGTTGSRRKRPSQWICGTGRSRRSSARCWGWRISARTP